MLCVARVTGAQTSAPEAFPQLSARLRELIVQSSSNRPPHALLRHCIAQCRPVGEAHGLQRLSQSP